ncbi:MAG: hypothetical protein AUJ25_02075 [Parcubacteria group bacterium CG1_02_37_13]|nr:MAG: hypothetical protein AUJ25_02075 [Parcubacteria group bacterium CG1_02_37_13]
MAHFALQNTNSVGGGAGFLIGGFAQKSSNINQKTSLRWGWDSKVLPEGQADLRLLAQGSFGG